MTTVRTKKVVDCLSREDREQLEVLVTEFKNEQKEADEKPIVINSEYFISSNKIVVRETLVTADIETLAYYVANNVKDIIISYSIIRPDVLNYITSSDVKYRPIINQYSYSLPQIYSWNKVE